MTDTPLTGHALVTDPVHFQEWVLFVGPSEHVTVRVDTTVTGMDEASAAHPYTVPTASARITRIGRKQLGHEVPGTHYHFFETCPTAWQGFLDGTGEVAVTLRTIYAAANAVVHINKTRFSVDGVVQDTSHDGQAVADHQLNPLIHDKQ